MVIYAQDNESEFPRSGGKPTTGTPTKWSTVGYITNWYSTSETDAFSGVDPTIGSCFYLLVKYADAGLKQFICKGDVGAEIFKLSDYHPPASVTKETAVWDFGTGPAKHTSYSYHMPFNWPAPGAPGGGVTYQLCSTSNPAAPLCADRNPFLDRNAKGASGDTGGYVDGFILTDTPPSWASVGGTFTFYDPSKTENAYAHQREGQNVMYCDISVRFQLQPICGIANDNIWKHWSASPPASESDRQGVATLDPGGGDQATGKYGPMSEDDAFLVNEHQDTWKRP
jgi:hypothetical protein